MGYHKQWLIVDSGHKPKLKFPKGYWFYCNHFYTIKEHIAEYNNKRFGGICGFGYRRLRKYSSRLNEERHLRLSKTNDGLSVTIVVSGRFPHGYEFRRKPRFRKPLNIWDQEKHNKACRAIIRILKRYNVKRENV